MVVCKWESHSGEIIVALNELSAATYSFIFGEFILSDAGSYSYLWLCDVLKERYVICTLSGIHLAKLAAEEIGCQSSTSIPIHLCLPAVHPLANARLLVPAK